MGVVDPSDRIGRKGIRSFIEKQKGAHHGQAILPGSFHLNVSQANDSKGGKVGHSAVMGVVCLVDPDGVSCGSGDLQRSYQQHVERTNPSRLGP